MSQQAVYELIGYAASVLVAISLMMSSVLRLRIINLLGAVTFTVYGYLISAYPVAAVNLLIVGINIFHLRKMTRTREYFELLEIDTGSPYLASFLRYHEEQIRHYFPTFDGASGSDVALFVLRDMVPAGLLLGRVEGDVLQVHLDFVIPEYRDLKVGRYLFYERCEYFSDRGVRSLVADGGPPVHEEYLGKMGFTPEAGDAGDRKFRLRLPC